jgi:peptidoglycan/LPS O-acetylase OafA/YrhL
MVALGKTTLIDRKGMLLFGAMTYPLYLIHQNIGYMIFNEFGESTNKYVLLLLTVSLMMVASYVIHRSIEPRISVPLHKLLNRAVSVFRSCFDRWLGSSTTPPNGSKRTPDAKRSGGQRA